MGDRIQVPLELTDFEVISSELVEGVLEVSIESTRRPACRHCGSLDVVGHGRHERRIRDRACGYPTVLRWSQRRVACRDCGHTSRETHPEVAGAKAITHRFRRRLFERAVTQPLTHVAWAEEVSCYRVAEAFETLAPQEIVSTPIEPPRVVSIDESAFTKKLRFNTALCDPERGIVFDLVEGRGEHAVVAGLLGLRPQVRANIDTVVTDLYPPFRNAVRSTLPQARLVVDKFHVLRAIDQAAQRVRRRFGRLKRSEREGRGGRMRARQTVPANDPRIFRVRWVFMKRAEKLTASEQDWLESVFDVTDPELRCAWWLKEAFASIYAAPDKAEAERRLDVWVDNMRASRLREFSATWAMLQRWRREILAYFDDPVTNAFAEGITNKIKVIKRSSYGFRNAKRYRQKVLLACGPRRTNGPTHRISR